jgi:polyphosphate kinase 2 (PPK2 family)
MPPDDSTFVKFDIATKELADARVRFTEADYTKKASELREEVANVKRELFRCKQDIIKIIQATEQATKNDVIKTT